MNHSAAFLRPLCQDTILGPDHLPHARPRAPDKTKGQRLLASSLFSLFENLNKLAFDESPFQHFIVTQPQIGNICGAEPQDIFQCAPHFPQPEIYADSF